MFIHARRRKVIKGKSDEFFLDWAPHSKEQHRLETDDNDSSAEGNQAGYCRQVLTAHRWGGGGLWNLISPTKISGKQHSTKHCQNIKKKEWEEHFSRPQDALDTGFIHQEWKLRCSQVDCLNWVEAGQAETVLKLQLIMQHILPLTPSLAWRTSLILNSTTVSVLFYIQYFKFL